MEEVIFLCGLVRSNEKERTDMKLENACMKQAIADMKLEKAGMKLEMNMLTLVFSVFLAVMITLDSTLVFHVTLLKQVSMNFFYLLPLN